MRYLLILLFIIFMGCIKQDSEICSPFIPEASDQYMFPVRPGMPEWGKFKSGQEMIEALQVPAETLNSMSTYGLVETCLDYPLLGNMLAYTSLQEGAKSQMDNFNGLKALETRNDAAHLMLSRFKLMDPSCPTNGMDLVDYSLFFIYMGMIQAQNVFIEQLNSSEKGELLKEAIRKYNLFVQLGDPYSIFNRKVEALIMARVMIIEDFAPFLEEISRNNFMNIFIKDVELNDNVETLNTILDYATKF